MIFDVFDHKRTSPIQSAVKRSGWGLFMCIGALVLVYSRLFTLACLLCGSRCHRRTRCWPDRWRRVIGWRRYERWEGR